MISSSCWLLFTFELLWLGHRPDSIAVRTSTDSGRRSVDEIPLEELARAGYLMLEAGAHMIKEDLQLEIARLYGHERMGPNIQSHISDAVEVLIQTGCGEYDQATQRVEYTDVDVDRRLLD